MAIFDREDRLPVFGGDAEDARQPHPEHGTGASQQNSSGDSVDVACADGGGQGDHEGAEGADVAFSFLSAGEAEFEGVGEVALDDPGADGEKEVGAEKEKDEGPAPDPASDFSRMMSKVVKVANNNSITFSSAGAAGEKKIREQGGLLSGRKSCGGIKEFEASHH